MSFMRDRDVKVELSGRKALEWQQNIIYDILGKNADGKWTHTTFGFEVPRQNGKGEILLMRELYGLAAGERVLHTAHRTDTSHKAWERLRDVLDSLRIPYYSIKAKGQEVLEIRNGGKVEFRTRTNTGGLGETFDVLIIDEAQEAGMEEGSGRGGPARDLDYLQPGTGAGVCRVQRVRA